MGSMDSKVEGDIDLESSFSTCCGCESSEESEFLVSKSGELTCKDVDVVLETNPETEKKRWRPYSNKPPRPPKGPLLDASDMVLVRKISEIAAKKRERIERTRALKKMKGAKGSSSSCGCSLVAMVLTVIFLIVIIIQGLCSNGGIRFHGSPVPLAATNGLINVQFYSKPPVNNEMNGPVSRYPNSEEPASGSLFQMQEGRDVQ